MTDIYQEIPPERVTAPVEQLACGLDRYLPRSFLE
jgi:hypothetical protein